MFCSKPTDTINDKVETIILVVLPLEWFYQAAHCRIDDRLVPRQKAPQLHRAFASGFHVIQNADSVYRIYYDAANVTSNEEGTITAYPLDSNASFYYGRVNIKIQTPSAVGNTRVLWPIHNTANVRSNVDFLGRKGTNQQQSRNHHLISASH
jgi:hypothetical protein